MESAILSAVEAGDVGKVRELLKSGVSSDEDIGKTLCVACACGQLGVARMLISEFQADVNCKDDSGMMPLHHACTSKHLDVARVLISEFKANLNCVYGDRMLLHHACASGHLNVARMLIAEFNTDVECKDSSRRTPLHYACVNGHLDVVQMLVSEFNAVVDSKDDNGRTPLHDACASKHLNVAKVLTLEFDTGVNCSDGSGETPLHHACASGQIDVVRVLISELNAGVDCLDVINMTPLHHACANGHLDVVRMLVSEFQTAVNSQDYRGRTSLHHACAGGHLDVVRTLISELKADINCKDGNGRTPLHLACSKGQLQVVRVLVSESRNEVWESARDSEGNTPLHVAAMCGNSEVILALINECNCDIYIRGQHGRSLLHSACVSSSPFLVEHISQYISTWVVDDDGYTPLHVACRSKHGDILAVLLKGSAPIMIRNNLGETPRDIATVNNSAMIDRYVKQNKAKIYSHYKAIQAHAKAKYSVAERITRVFVIGNPGAGKSSLIETLKREGFFESLRRVTKTSVPLHTAGIVPSIYTSKHYGRVLFYDFAGDAEYYSSHAAILENFACSGKGVNIFFIVVDLRDEMAVIEGKVQYWLSFIEYQQFQQPKPTMCVIGSHFDLLTGELGADRKLGFQKLASRQDCAHFLLDCCQPNSPQIADLRSLMVSQTKDSPRFELSPQAGILLGMLEMEFSNVPACSVEVIASHIKQTGIQLPTKFESLHIILRELHDLGLLFLIHSESKGDLHVVLHMSQLTSIVHKALFSEQAKVKLRDLCDTIGDSISFKVGIIPQSSLVDILPKNITKECLTQLQYCQEISCKDVCAFPSLAGSDSSDQSFLFFPALCAADKSEVPWVTPPDLKFGIGWLARCTGPYDYFPPRFLHVLILRVIFHFTLSVPTPTLNASSDHRYFDHFCTMWKNGVRWLTRERVEYVVELLNNSKEVVVLVKSEEAIAEKCIVSFREVISCVMEAKAEFCHSIKPEFFLLDSTDESDYLHEGNLFAMADVECALLSPDKDGVVSVTRTRRMQWAKISHLHQRSYWHVLFPITIASVLDYLKDIVDELYMLGLYLNVPSGILNDLDVNFPTDIDRRRRELVKGWLNSSAEPACWWRLVEALRKAQNIVLAEHIKETYGK